MRSGDIAQAILLLHERSRNVSVLNLMLENGTACVEVRTDGSSAVDVSGTTGFEFAKAALIRRNTEIEAALGVMGLVIDGPDGGGSLF